MAATMRRPKLARAPRAPRLGPTSLQPSKRIHRRRQVRRRPLLRTSRCARAQDMHRVHPLTRRPDIVCRWSPELSTRARGPRRKICCISSASPGSPQGRRAATLRGQGSPAHPRPHPHHHQAYEAQARAIAQGVGGAAGAAGAAGVAEETVWFGYARRLEAWLQDCTTLVGYVPREAPVQEDHKRLLMLLHDLGGTLVLLQLLGALGEALVGAAALGELGGFIAGFGEENRKTAVSRALASATAVPAAPAEGAALLQRHGLCAQAAEEGAAAAEQDTWSEVGWRLCAALLLRAGRPEEAVALLKARTADAPTLHAFMGAFELASRVPPPRLPAGGGAEASSVGVSLGEASPSRFSLEQVAEVLDAALLRPQHGLASEGNLLRRHLRTALSFGQPANVAPAPPLACPPPPPAQRQDAPRLVVVVPFVAAEKPRLLAGLRRWAAEARPCEPPATVDAAGHAERGPVDLLLYAAWEAQPRSSSAAAAAAADD
eukprot:scaffold119034_cov63-Phaeocystis_antarctica.AAC.1